MDEVALLIQKAQEGDEEARRFLVTENLGLVHHIVKRFLGRGYEAEDLFQIGTIGLLKAVDKFDLSYDVRFSTYAVPMIQGEIRRFLRDDGIVKVSRTLKENGWKISRSAEALGQELGRAPTADEIAKAVNLSVEDIALAMEANTEVESIYKSVYQGDDSSFVIMDKLQNENDPHDELLNHMLLEQLLSSLPLEERKLIQLRYFDNITQVEVAKQLHVSQVQVSRMEKRILLKLRYLCETDV